ncbi:MAG: serine hydrolase domain-containing protein [Flavobacteriaceae bacterium]
MKKVLKIVFGVLIALYALLYISSYNYVIPGLIKIYGTGHTTAFLHDYEVFDNRTVEASDKPQKWPVHKKYNTIEPTDRLMKAHKEYKTVAYLIIKNDSIFHEKYYNGYSDTSKSNSFSMAKSMVTGMLGKAIEDRKIESIDQRVGYFFEEFNDGNAADLTVGDLASMASGLDWVEEYYNPLNITTQSYFTDDLQSLLLNRKIIGTPGQEYSYLSGNTQLLGMIIQKAVGSNLSDYFSENFWKPMGAKENALWQIDSKKNGMEKAFCCFASNAKDFARFGKLYKDHGKWNGKKLIDSTFVALSVRPRFKNSPEYGYGWWLSEIDEKPLFAMRGHLGQYVIVIPEDDMIVVRLGHLTGKPNETEFPKVFHLYIEEAYKMLENAAKS